jgi:hypothetical protein
VVGRVDGEAIAEPDDVAKAIADNSPAIACRSRCAVAAPRRPSPSSSPTGRSRPRELPVAAAADGLVLVPLAVVLYARRERGTGLRSRRLRAAPLVPSVAPRRSGWRRHAPAALYALALAGLVLAVARRRRRSPSRWSRPRSWSSRTARAPCSPKTSPEPARRRPARRRLLPRRRAGRSARRRVAFNTARPSSPSRRTTMRRCGAPSRASRRRAAPPRATRSTRR